MLSQQKTNPEKEEEKGGCFVYDFWGLGCQNPKNHKQNTDPFFLPFLDLFSAVPTQIFLQICKNLFFGVKNCQSVKNVLKIQKVSRVCHVCQVDFSHVFL